LGDKIGQADALNSLSISNRDLILATAFANEALGLYTELGDLSGIASTSLLLARLRMWSGDFSSTKALLAKALPIAIEIVDPSREEELIITSGNLAYWQGDYTGAIEFHAKAMRLSETIGDNYQNLWARVFMAYAVLRQGDIQDARQLFQDCIRRAQEGDSQIVLVFAVEGLASLCVCVGETRRAATVFAWADTMRDRIGDHRPPVEQNSVERDLAAIHAQLDDSTYDAAYQTGRAMTTDQVVAYAMQTKGQILDG